MNAERSRLVRLPRFALPALVCGACWLIGPVAAAQTNPVTLTIDASSPGYAIPTNFIGVSVSVMRRILIDHARRKRTLKRGLEVQGVVGVEDYAGLSFEQADDLLALNLALDRLEEMSSRQRQVVE